MNRTENRPLKRLAGRSPDVPLKGPMSIVISGFYGVGNLGDEAILSAIMGSVRSICPSAGFTVLSLDTDETKGSHGVDAVYRPDFGLDWHKTEFRKMISAVRSADLVIIGGGGLLEDVHNYLSIPRYLHTVLLAKVFSKPVMFYSIGAGPIRNTVSKLLVKSFCDLSEVITVRDEESREVLKSLGINAPVHVFADPVFSLTPASSKRVDEILSREQVPMKRPVIGVSVREVDWFAVGEEEFAMLMDRLIEGYGATIVFIPFGYDGVPSDYDVSDRIRQRMRHPAIILKGRYRPEEIMGLIGRLDLLIGMRLHSLIMSISMGVPAVGISYLPKVSSMLRSLSYREDCIICDFSSEDVLQAVHRSLDLAEPCISGSLDQTKARSGEPARLMGSIRARENSRLKITYLTVLFSISLALLVALQINKSKLGPRVHGLRKALYSHI